MKRIFMLQEHYSIDTKCVVVRSSMLKPGKILHARAQKLLIVVTVIHRACVNTCINICVKSKREFSSVDILSPQGNGAHFTVHIHANRFTIEKIGDISWTRGSAWFTAHQMSGQDVLTWRRQGARKAPRSGPGRIVRKQEGAVLRFATKFRVRSDIVFRTLCAQNLNSH